MTAPAPHCTITYRTTTYDCGKGYRPRRARGRDWASTCVESCHAISAACSPIPSADQCDDWISAQLAAGARVVRETHRARVAAREYERGSYQRGLLAGRAMSGGDLRGRARSYAARYAASRANLVERIARDMRSLGVSAHVARGLRGRRVLVIRDEWARWGGHACVEWSSWIAPPEGSAWIAT